MGGACDRDAAAAEPNARIGRREDAGGVCAAGEPYRPRGREWRAAGYADGCEGEGTLLVSGGDGDLGGRTTVDARGADEDFQRFTSELDGSGEKISQELSEIDLSNPEDVQALIPDHSTEILVHFGDQDFLERYQRFQQHLPEWRATYPKLSSVDMRYERQVVLQMPPGSGVPAASSSKATESAAPADSKTASAIPSVGATRPDNAVAKPLSKSIDKPGIKSADKPLPVTAQHVPVTAQHGAVTKTLTKNVAKAPVHVTAQSEVAFDVPAKGSTPKAKTHAAAAKPHAVIVKHPASTTQYDPTQVVHP